VNIEPAAGIDKRFQIRRLIGTGSFGVVYEAFDTHRNRDVALKTLTHADADSVARFKREFRSLTELRHPNLASLYELLVLGDEWALVMELVRGTDLLEHLSFTEIQNAFLDPVDAAPFDPDARMSVRRKPKHGKLSATYLQQVRDMFRQLAEAIAFLHAHGVVHRDVKPSNVMITPEGRVVLLDFGLAIDAKSELPFDSEWIVGTPGYMSPEQIAKAKPAAASDWYSFGVMLYQALTGQLLFPGANAGEIMEQQLRSTPLSVCEVLPGLPEDLCSLADRCIARDVALRPGEGEILEVLGSSLPRARGEVRAHRRQVELIGRGREVRTLVRHINAIASEGSGMVLLHGSPGVGKTVLADRVLDEIRSTTGALILGGRCRGWESLPFNAIDTLVDSLARITRTDVPPAIEELMSRSVAMTRLFPTLAFPAVIASSDEETVVLPATPEQAMSRAASELRQLIDALAGGRPVLLFLDDAQWGDYQSAQIFLRLLDTSSPGPRIVLVLCYSTEDWRTSLLLQTMVYADVRKEEVEVEALSLSLADKLVKRELPDATKAERVAVVQQSAGNPGLMEMILRHEGERTLTHAVAALLDELSTSARRIFALLLDANGPLPDFEIERRLELFESDEPLRSLTRARLGRLRRTGGLFELGLYHPRLREAARESHAHR